MQRHDDSNGTGFPRVEVLNQRDFNSLGYCIRLLMEEVESDWFVYLHADVYLPRGWFDAMRPYQERYDWFECNRQMTVLFEYPSKAQNKKSRAYSGSQMGRRATFEKVLHGVDDDYLYRNEDVVFQELIEGVGGRYGRVPDTFHYHQIMNRRGEAEPKLERVVIDRERDCQWERRTFQMQFKGLVKYTNPTKLYLIKAVKRSLDKLAAMDIDKNELARWVEKTNSAWTPHLQGAGRRRRDRNWIRRKATEGLAPFLKLSGRAARLTLADLRRMTRERVRELSPFEFDGALLQYSFHSYNNFGVTERATEIPIIKHFLQRHKGRVLEIGNVTNYYYDQFAEFTHDRTVVDKLETGYGVTTLDIADYSTAEPFDFIFSISTFEHMDSDRGRTPGYAGMNHELTSVASDNMRYVCQKLLNAGGTFVVTAPLGYAVEFDRTFYSDDFTSYGMAKVAQTVFQKTSESTWKQVGAEVGRSAAYGRPHNGVNFLAVVEFTAYD